MASSLTTGSGFSESSGGFPLVGHQRLLKLKMELDGQSALVTHLMGGRNTNIGIFRKHALIIMAIESPKALGSSLKWNNDGIQLVYNLVIT